MGDAALGGSPPARIVGTWLLAVLLAVGLLVPPGTPAAEGAAVLACVKKISRTSGIGSAAGREVIAAVACQGVREEQVGTREFEEKVKVLRDCFGKVTFQLDTRGADAEIIAANACVGAVDAGETAACMEKVERRFRSAKDAAAESLAATACARGNPAEETARCIEHVSFRLEASGVLADALAAIACGR